MTRGPFGRVLAISPHLDDVVLGCGQALSHHPDSAVVTLFAGAPPASAPATEWDAACGLASPQQAVATRRSEDRAALRALDAWPVWLDYLDAQYGGRTRPDEIAPALASLVLELRPRAVWLPLGLFHEDHVRAREAALLACAPDAGRPRVVYEDALYRRIDGLRAAALRELRLRGLRLQPLRLVPLGDPARKRRALGCYASQLRGLSSRGRPGHEDALRPERFWLLSG